MWTFTAKNPPRVAEIATSIADDTDLLVNQDDTYLYEEIDFAVAVQLPSQRPKPRESHLLRVRSLLEIRFNSGWFSKTAKLTFPQACYTIGPNLPEIHVRNIQARSVAEEKPQGALWTSSFLPNGAPAWQAREREEFAELGRSLYRLQCDAQTISVYTIDSFVDFQRLLLKFPQSNPSGRATVRWRDVAERFDAVHLTARGLVDLDGIEFETPYGVAAFRGWGSESTAWLRGIPSGKLSLVTNR
ncbi:hypothetical protein [Saccharopolyspora hattusasensis]|uniref:hypothetical protein n=1 Tax=Saccharopolyspora hattusasensis TaxID=1128679 RepID=UPI003D961435